MDYLVEDFKKSLFENFELLSEYLELGIDAFIENEILKEVPIVSSIVSILKTGKNIHDRNLLKQTLYFIDEFNKGNIDKSKLKKYKSKIENNTQKCKKELGRVMLIVNNNIDIEKSIILAKLFKSYINEKIDWEEFCEFSEILNRIFIQDLKILKMIYQGTLRDTTNRNDLFRVERLNSLGIIGLSFKSTKNSSTNGIIRENRQDSYVSLNNNGIKFMNAIGEMSSQ